jgi:hypothetical protein
MDMNRDGMLSEEEWVKAFVHNTTTTLAVTTTGVEIVAAAKATAAPKPVIDRVLVSELTKFATLNL